MSLRQTNPTSKKREGDPCPACYSSDAKKIKGTLEKKKGKRGLHCTVCMYSCAKSNY